MALPGVQADPLAGYNSTRALSLRIRINQLIDLAKSQVALLSGILTEMCFRIRAENFGPLAARFSPFYRG